MLLVSDLPLQGGIHITATQMAQAITFVLRERGFRAGKFAIAYQSCDDSIATSGLYDEAKCEANARAYAQNPQVVGVIGPLNSPCAVVAIPPLNRAPDGPLAMISPFNSFVGLTRSGPGVHPSLPASLYPTGKRNYVRVFPTDDLQGAALALFARDRDRRARVRPRRRRPRLRSAPCDGLRQGFAPARPDNRRSSELGSSRRRLFGTSQSASPAPGRQQCSWAACSTRTLPAWYATFVHDWGLPWTSSGPDGLTPVPLFVEQAGKAALGVYVSTAGGVIDHLPPQGARFVERFGRRRPGSGSSRPRCTRPRLRTCCWTRSRARTELARRLWRNCSGRTSRTGCSGRSASIATATSPRAR